MADRVGPQIEEELPPEIPAPDEPENPPAEYMTAPCEQTDYAAIARRHIPVIKAMLKKETV